MSLRRLTQSTVMSPSLTSPSGVSQFLVLVTSRLSIWRRVSHGTCETFHERRFLICFLAWREESLLLLSLSHGGQVTSDHAA